MEAPPATAPPAAPTTAPPAAPPAAAPKPAEPKPPAAEPGPPAALPPGAAARDSAVWNLPIRTYLDQTIVPIMLDGMAELVKVNSRRPLVLASMASPPARHRRDTSKSYMARDRTAMPSSMIGTIV